MSFWKQKAPKKKNLCIKSVESVCVCDRGDEWTRWIEERRGRAWRKRRRRRISTRRRMKSEALVCNNRQERFLTTSWRKSSKTSRWKNKFLDPLPDKVYLVRGSFLEKMEGEVSDAIRETFLKNWLHRRKYFGTAQLHTHRHKRLHIHITRMYITWQKCRRRNKIEVPNRADFVKRNARLCESCVWEKKKRRLIRTPAAHNLPLYNRKKKNDRWGSAKDYKRRYKTKRKLFL